jgi:class 3 adenylate cyclase
MAMLQTVSISTRRKLVSIAVAMVIFAALAGLATAALGRPLLYSVSNALMTGVGVGLFEEFYVQGMRGRWLRAMHPLRSILVYAVVVVVIYLAALHLSHLILGHWSQLPTIYRRLPMAIPMFLVLSAVGIGVMRVVHFIGAENLFHLMVGTYHRPVSRGVVLMFVDINGSTAISERLGALKMSSLLRKFLFDIAKPITDQGGEIYLYKGDGLIAVWDWNAATRDGAVLRAIDRMVASVRWQSETYLREFGIVPTFRVGVHGGPVVVSEQGDTKRSIGIYGDTINITARMEDAAKAHGVFCAISGDVAKALDGGGGRIHALGEETIRGISDPILVCEYRPQDAAEPVPSRPAFGLRWLLAPASSRLEARR